MPPSFIAVSVMLLAGPAPGAPESKRLLDEAEAHIRGGEYPQALALAQSVAGRAQGAGDRATLARALMLSADVFYYQDRREEMRAGYERALGLYQALGDDAGVGRAYYSLSYYYERTRPEEMAAILRKAAPYAERSGDRRLQTNVENALGQALTNLGRYGEAIGRFEASGRLASALGDERGRAVALMNVGAVEQLRGNYEKALECGLAAEGAFERLKNPAGVANAVGNLGSAYHGLGDLDRAVAHHQQSLELYQKLESKSGRAAQLAELAGLRSVLGDTEEARRLYGEALSLSIDAGSERRTIFLLSQLAKVLIAGGFFREAEEQLEEGRRRAQVVGDAWLQTMNARDRAELEIARHQDAAAAPWLDRAEALARRMGYANDLGGVLTLRGEIRARQGRVAEAVSAYEEAIGLHVRGHAWRYVPRWQGRLARLYEQLGDAEKARSHYEESLRAMEDLDRAVMMDRTRLVLREEVADVYAEYARWLAARGEVRRGWQVLESGRARVLRMRLLSAPGEADLSEAERDALAALRDLERRLREGPAGDESRRLPGRIAGAEQRYEAARRAAGRTAAPVAPLHLPSDAIVVEYARIEDALLVFSHADGHDAFRILPEAARLMDDARAYARALSDAASPFEGRAVGASLLHRLLGAELAGHAGGRLVIVPDDALSALPFGALVTPDGSFLTERFTVSEAPSLDTLRRVEGGPADGAFARILAVAETRFDGADRASASLPGLAAAAGEARRVAGQGRGSEVLIDASESQVKALPLATYQVLHFATHVRTDEARPERSSIVLGRDAEDDGELQAREVEGLRLAARLVVVSGCGSARGRFVAGEGVLGLSHAFLVAGARSLVLSRWDVSDDGSAAFMEAFYAALREEPVAEAVRQAQLDLMHSRQWAHPAHWAAFVVSGDGQQRLRLAPQAPVALWVLLGAAVLLVLGWTARTFSGRRARS